MRTIFIIADKRWRFGAGVVLLSGLCFGGLAHAGAMQTGSATQEPEAPSSAPAAQVPAPAAAPVVEAPKLVQKVEAPYPPEALAARLEANVRLQLKVDVQGQVTEAEVMEPVGHGFDEAARTAALQFRFEPGKRDGVVKRFRILYTYAFRLPESAAPASGEAAAAGSPPSEPVATQPVEMPSSTDENTIEVTVVGESAAERRRQSAESVQVIETEQIGYETADLGTALARTEGVDVRRAAGLGSNTRISLAGLSDDQVRFFVDGIPLEFAGYGPGLANVPVNLVQRMEVYQGVVPVRFGADVLGGAVHLITDQNVSGTGVSGSYELGAFDTHRLTASVRHLQESTGLLVRAHGFFDTARNDYPVNVEVFNDAGKLEPARLPRFHDGYQAGGASLEVGYVDRPWAQRLLLRAFINATERDIQHNTLMTQVYGDVTGAEGSAGTTLRYEQAFGQGLSVDAVAGYTFRRSRFLDVGTCRYDWYGRCFFTLPSRGEMDSGAVERYVNNHATFARFNAGWMLGGPHLLRFALAPTFVVRTGEDRQLQALGQADPLSADRDVASLVTGLEYQYDAFEGRLQNITFAKDYLQSTSAKKLLGSGEFQDLSRTTHEMGVGDSLRLRLSPTLVAKASYEWATRLPRPDELFGDGLLIDTNLELVPETSHNINLGLGFTSLPGRAGSFRANVGGFARLADQLITLTAQESYFVYQNVYAARSLGVVGAAGWTSPGQWLSLDANATWQDLRNVSSEGLFGEFDGQRIPNRPYLMANGSAQLKVDELLRSRDELLVTLRSRYTHEFFLAWAELGAVDTKLRVATQFTHSLALTYVMRDTPTTMSWTLDLQNLTNARTFDFFGVQRPGRTLAAKFTLER
ncbi:MAG: TonB family protein [Myxococcaceae bacterium]|nr:MAG: TonB family protein [Myxococcaceae bacterium]